MLCPDFAQLLAIGSLITAITMIAAALSAWMVCNSGDDDSL